eukprot:5476740-Prymnesium_polylepis.1
MSRAAAESEAATADVPQGAGVTSSSAISDEDLQTTLRVLRTLVAADGTIAQEYNEPRLKPLRVAMQGFLEDMRGKLYYGGSADKYAQRKDNKRRQAAKAQQERAMDRQAADKTQMRAERLRMLEELQQAAPSLDALPYVPDGAVDDRAASAGGAALLLQEVGANGAPGQAGEATGEEEAAVAALANPA